MCPFPRHEGTHERDLITLFLSSALDKVGVQLGAPAACPRPSRANGAQQMGSWVGPRAGQDASQKKKPVDPAVNQTTIPRSSSVTRVISLLHPANLQTNYFQEVEENKQPTVQR